MSFCYNSILRSREIEKEIMKKKGFIFDDYWVALIEI